MQNVNQCFQMPETSFCLNPSDIQFNVVEEQRLQETFTFKRLGSGIFSLIHFIIVYQNKGQAFFS